MITPVNVHLSLFKLDWPAEPEAALTAGREAGITDPHFIEMSAWCAELHAQLADLAQERDLPLLLMGGNATALRVEAAKQRGSRDNDYLTTESEEEIRGLMDALVARFAPYFDEPLFRYRQLTGKPATTPLPNFVAFAVSVPALLDPNADEGRLSIKLEFHIEDDPEMFPEQETIRGRFFALAQDVDARIPKLPYQIALKLMTLHLPPVGIAAGREDAIPRQLYDIDALLAQLADRQQWDQLSGYTARRYAKEERQRNREPNPDGPWQSILERLDEWSQTGDSAAPYGHHINTFQGSQVATGTKRTAEEWRGRVRRLQFAVRCLHQGESGWEVWRAALDVEARIPERPGQQLKAFRNAIAGVTGDVARKLGQFPRVPYWQHLALVADAAAAIDAFARSLDEHDLP